MITKGVSLQGEPVEEDSRSQAALQAEARLEGEKKPDKNDGDGTPPDKRKGTSPILTPTIMPASGGKYFIQAYNAQAAVDSANQIIVAAEVTNKPTDRGQAEPMMEIVKVNVGQLPCQDVSRCRILLK